MPSSTPPSGAGGSSAADAMEASAGAMFGGSSRSGGGGLGAGAGSPGNFSAAGGSASNLTAGGQQIATYVKSSLEIKASVAPACDSTEKMGGGDPVCVAFRAALQEGIVAGLKAVVAGVQESDVQLLDVAVTKDRRRVEASVGEKGIFSFLWEKKLLSSCVLVVLRSCLYVSTFKGGGLWRVSGQCSCCVGTS